MQATVPEEKLGLILKLGFYIFVAVIGLPVFGFLLSATGYLIAAAGSVFATAFTANSLALRVFERMPITAAGLGWRGGSGRNLAIGIVTGIVAATLVTLLPLALGMAEMKPDPDLPASASGALFVTVLLLFGAIGEELLFRGYAFQILARGIGPVPTLIFSAALFGAVHMANLNATALGIANTAGFGVVLGYAFLRTGELWLPIGIHFGWNWMLPVAGVNVSGFRIGMTGYSLDWKVSSFWSGGAYGPEASVLTSLIVVALLVFLRRAPVIETEAPLLALSRQEA
jgi:membrane protease YdiL (CAAX protease family)